MPDSSTSKSIGLCMIVKNEAHVITRCLNSVRPLVDFVYIEDTGSDDGTQQVIRDWLEEAGMPGEVVEVAWQDFAYNRTHALASLRRHDEIDYAMIIDADDILQFTAGFDADQFKQTLIADLIDVDVHHGAIKHKRPHLCRNSLEFTYRGVLHEFLQLPTGTIKRVGVKDMFINIGGGGARSQDPAKYSKDAATLEQVLETEKDAFLRARYTFYLAQSYRDSGQKQKALNAYLTRADLGFWQEEVYVSLLQAAKLCEQLDYPKQEVIAAYQRAAAAVPARVEAWHALSRYCRSKSMFEEGYQFAQLGLERQSVEGLFVEQWIYDYGLLDEYSISAYWTGRFIQSRDACNRILREAKIPASQRGRVEANLAFALAKLPVEA
jgi:glycosyltransferase involved in cell wall biosynthesis